ncbi:MAG: hypothetical protein NZ703_15040, partial [Gemmataceae bacterium]|nr:hypothetical protein [Gemmataceae bacterium]
MGGRGEATPQLPLAVGGQPSAGLITAPTTEKGGAKPRPSLPLPVHTPSPPRTAQPADAAAAPSTLHVPSLPPPEHFGIRLTTPAAGVIVPLPEGSTVLDLLPLPPPEYFG